MSTQIAYDTLKNRLVEQLGGTYPVLDWEQIETALQGGTAPFLAVDDSEGQSDLQSIGTPEQNWTKDVGFITVHIFVPSTGSLSTARGIGDMIRSVMRYFRFPVPEGQTLRCLTVSPPGPGVIFDGLWHSMMVTVDFEHEYPVATSVT